MVAARAQTHIHIGTHSYKHIKSNIKTQVSQLRHAQYVTAYVMTQKAPKLSYCAHAKDDIKKFQRIPIVILIETSQKPRIPILILMETSRKLVNANVRHIRLALR